MSCKKGSTMCPKVSYSSSRNMLISFFPAVKLVYAHFLHPFSSQLLAKRGWRVLTFGALFFNAALRSLTSLTVLTMFIFMLLEESLMKWLITMHHGHKSILVQNTTRCKCRSLMMLRWPWFFAAQLYDGSRLNFAYRTTAAALRASKLKAFSNVNLMGSVQEESHWWWGDEGLRDDEFSTSSLWKNNSLFCHFVAHTTHTLSSRYKAHQGLISPLQRP